MRSFLAIVLLFFSSTVATALTPRENTEYTMWLEACLWTQYSCWGIEPPHVEYEVMYKTYGWYDGGQTIHIRSNLDGMDLQATIFHETTHYLQWAVGGAQIPGFAKAICELEAEAFSETDAFLVRRNVPWMQRGSNWWRSYSYCRRFYDSFAWDWFRGM